MNKKRFLSLDVLKALGLIYIITLHQIVWVVFINDTGGMQHVSLKEFCTFYRDTGTHVFGYGIPLLAGVTFALSHINGSLNWLKVIQRALILAALGFGMNALSWGLYDPADIWDWDVLQFIALSMIVSYIFLSGLRPIWSKIILGTMAFVAVSFSNIFPEFALSSTYAYEVFFGNKGGEMYWAFFPWYALFACGCLTAYGLVSDDKKNLYFMATMGLILLSSSLASGQFMPILNFENIWGISFFKPSPFVLSGIIGVILFCIPAFELMLGRWATLQAIVKKSFMMDYSLGILWIYLLTTLIGYHGTMFLKDNFVFDANQSLGLIGVTTAVNLFLAYMIGKIARRARKQA